MYTHSRAVPLTQLLASFLILLLVFGTSGASLASAQEGPADPPAEAEESTELEESSAEDLGATSTDEHETGEPDENLIEEDDTAEEQQATSTATSSPENAATSTATSTSSSGSAPEDEDVSIVSGKAVALANVLNVINTNVINSNGVVFFSNFFEALSESLDLRALSEGGFLCSLMQCDSAQTTIKLDNNAAIENSLFVEATSGGNQIEGAGNASIKTGDAYAGLNLVNVANTNFVDSNYLLVTINAFDDVNGDVIFPSTASFLSSLAQSGPVSANVENKAELVNNVEVDADSGGNTLTDVGNGTIETGSAHAETNVFNEINTSFFGGQSVTILFRVHGTWAGEIFGASDDLLWTQGPDGSIFIVDAASAGTGSSTASGGTVDISGTNNAKITNNVKVAALTGENLIDGAETALISTGNAYAGANLINVANGNVVGRNWILAIVNIFGNFNGNIAFGRPDLWIGETIETSNDLRNGDRVEYRFTVINNGDSPATEVVVEDAYASTYLDVADSAEYTISGDQLIWNVGTLAPGAAAELTYSGTVVNASCGVDIENTVSVTSRETDGNTLDNEDTAAVGTWSCSSGGGSGNDPEWREAWERKQLLHRMEDQAFNAETPFKVERLTHTSALSGYAPQLRQEIVITNMTASSITDVVFHDILRNADGGIIQDEVWKLGDVLPHEEIRLGYDITFGQLAVGGRYTLESTIGGAGTATHYFHNGTVWFAALYDPRRATPEPFASAVEVPLVVATSTLVHPDLRSLFGTDRFYVSVGPLPNGSTPTLFERLMGYVSSVVSALASLVDFSTLSWR